MYTLSGHSRDPYDSEDSCEELSSLGEYLSDCEELNMDGKNDMFFKFTDDSLRDYKIQKVVYSTEEIEEKIRESDRFFAKKLKNHPLTVKEKREALLSIHNIQTQMPWELPENWQEMDDADIKKLWMELVVQDIPHINIEKDNVFPHGLVYLKGLRGLIVNPMVLSFDELEMETLQRVTYLGLNSRTFMADVPEKIWSLQNVKSLYLKKFTNPTYENIHRLKGVRTLKLEALSFIALPLTVCELNLTTLSLHKNPRMNDLSKITRLTNLKKLDLVHNGLREVPMEIFELTSLEYLELNDDFIAIPSEIGNLKKLRELHIMNTNVRKLPHELTLLEDLRYLIICYNHSLMVLPKEMFALTNLRQLDLEDNDIRELPEDIGDLKKLKYLNVSDNGSLRKLPDSFKKIRDQVELKMENTQIQE